MTLAFARFDLQTWALQRQPLLILGLVAAIGVVLPVPGLAIVGAALVTSVTVSVPFLGDERGRLDTLYGVLPVSRRAVVTGRALALLAYAASAAVVATIATYVVGAVRNEPVPLDVVLIALAVAAGIVGLSLSLQLPVLFRVGFSRGRFMAYAPSAVLAGAAWIAQAVGLMDGAAAVQGPPVAVVGAAGAAVLVVGVAVGLTLGVASYRRRSL